MQKKKQKGRLTVEKEKDRTIDKYLLNPHIGVGEFHFGTKINRYLKGKNYSFYPKGQGDAFYCFEDPNLDVIIDHNDYISTVTCEHILYYKGLNFIGAKIDIIINLLNSKPTNTEKLWISEKRRHTVYDFDDLGILIWTYRKKVVNITCFNLIEVPSEAKIQKTTTHA